MRAGLCLTRRHLPKKVPKKKRLTTHHAVVNILTFIRRWREIPIQPCFTDSVARQRRYIRISTGFKWSPKSDTSQTEYDNHQWVQYREFRFRSGFPTGKRNHRLNAFWCGSFQITTNEIDGKTTRPFFGIVFTWPQTLPGNRPCRYASP